MHQVNVCREAPAAATFPHFLQERMKRSGAEVDALFSDHPQLGRYFLEGPVSCQHGSTLQEELLRATERLMDVFEKLAFDLSKFPDHETEILESWEAEFGRRFNDSPYVVAQMERWLDGFSRSTATSLNARSRTMVNS